MKLYNQRYKAIVENYRKFLDASCTIFTALGSIGLRHTADVFDC
jgi:hypothetical protein